MYLPDLSADMGGFEQTDGDCHRCVLQAGAAMLGAFRDELVGAAVRAAGKTIGVTSIRVGIL